MMGTFTKSFGAAGGYIAADTVSHNLFYQAIHYLTNLSLNCVVASLECNLMYWKQEERVKQSSGMNSNHESLKIVS